MQYFDARNYPLKKIASVSDDVGKSPNSLPAPVVAKLLASNVSVFNRDNPSGLEPNLPSSTTSHLALSFSDANEPVYVILVTTPVRHYTFPDVDHNFIRNIGSILLAKSVQARVMLADLAKTSFLSAISHELRTPMHAVTQSHTLMHEALDAKAYDDLEALLELSASSSQTLTNILNDVLDYGKDTSGDYREHHQQFVPDLAGTTVQIAKITEMQHLDEASTVVIVVEYEDRDWGIYIDEARFSR